MRTRDLVVVVTGASSGIGRATALAFAAKGCAVALAARREAALEQVAEECSARDGQALAVPTDVSDPVAVMELAARTVDRFGRIDVWVNNAAVSVWGPFQETPLEDFRRVLDVDVMGYVHGARAALPIMREQGRGVLINVASVVGIVPNPYAFAYTMSKFAVRGLSGSLRQELRLARASGVKVCTVLPSTIDTPLFQQGANYTGRAVKAMPPVYSPERAARTIVNVVRRPRREVVVGPIGRALWLQSKLTPGLVERAMAVHVERTHLSPHQSAPVSVGNLYEPASDSGSVDGGWHGKQRTAIRRAGTIAVMLTAATLAGRRWLR